MMDCSPTNTQPLGSARQRGHKPFPTLMAAAMSTFNRQESPSTPSPLYTPCTLDVQPPVRPLYMTTRLRACIPPLYLVYGTCLDPCTGVVPCIHSQFGDAMYHVYSTCLDPCVPPHPGRDQGWEVHRMFRYTNAPVHMVQYIGHQMPHARKTNKKTLHYPCPMCGRLCHACMYLPWLMFYLDMVICMHCTCPIYLTLRSGQRTPYAPCHRKRRLRPCTSYALWPAKKPWQ